MDIMMQDRTQQPLQILLADRLYNPQETAGPVAVVLAGATIYAIWPDMDAAAVKQYAATHLADTEVDIVDLRPLSLAPGYIDLHIHGYAGYDVTTGSAEDIEAMARALPRTGVTAFFPTIATLGREETARQVQMVARATAQPHPKDAAEILGIRLEGPFISHAKKGAQFEAGIRRPDADELRYLCALGQGLVRIVDYAPEEDNEGHFLAAALQLGLLPAIGHTAATYEQTQQALDGGARHATHLFNAMAPLGHRAPGPAGAFLTDRRTTVEIIADGIHLHPAMTRLILVACGPQDVALITDAIAPTGLPDGEYDFVGRKVHIHAGAARMQDGTLSGSVLTLDSAVKNIVRFAGISWSTAIAMATQVPARIVGIAHRAGQIEPGADANLIAIDSNGTVERTWIGGSLAYQRTP